MSETILYVPVPAELLVEYNQTVPWKQHGGGQYQTAHIVGLH